jgi:murein DD-endopeptidase MepM/ murein hydrolase activator NlpD
MTLFRTLATVLLVVPLLGAPAPAPVDTADGAPAPGASPASSTHWAWPGDNPREVLRPFLAPATRYGAGHRGIDIATVDVRAPADGTVHYSGILFGRGVLSVEHGDGVLSSYEPVLSNLRRGEKVSRGQVLGTVSPAVESPDSTLGHCAVPCLHFGVRILGEYVSPMNYFISIPRSVLLPRFTGRR